MGFNKLLRFRGLSNYYYYYYKSIHHLNTNINNTKLFRENLRFFHTHHTHRNIYESDADEHDDLLPDDNKLNIRNILYKNSKDPLVQELNECASVQDVFNIIRKNNVSMNDVQVTQAVLVLWDLQKIFYKHNIYYENENDSNGSLLNVNAILKKYISQVSGHEDFNTLIRLIIKNYEKFSLDGVTCTLLYLHRMGVSIKAHVMQLMITRCENEIKNCDRRVFPLTALSRFIVTIYQQESLYPVLVSINALPIVLQRLEGCVTEEDFKLLTICLYRMRQLVVLDNVDTYKCVASRLIDEKKLTNQHGRTILKALKFLTSSQWFECNIQCTNQLMQLLKNSLSQFNSEQLLTIFKIFQLQKEPADMLEELQEHALYQVSNLEEEDSSIYSNSLETILELLSCVVLFSSPLEKPKFEKLTRRYIDYNLTIVSLNALYKILYHIKSTDEQLCNKFWDKSYEIIMKDTSASADDLLKNILTLCLKYIHFSQDVGHQYRYLKFEEKMIEYFNEVLMNEIQPEQFVRIASFLLAYNKDPHLDEKIMDQLLEMKHLFSAMDVLNISKGMQFALDHKYKYKMSRDVVWKRVQMLNDALNECIAQEIQQNDDCIKLSVVNMFLRSFVIRKCYFEEIDLFKNMLELFARDSQQLNSHFIKDLSFYLHINSYLQPNVIERMVEYVIDNDERVLGSTVEKLLQLCYFLGYTTNKSHEFFNIASRIIVRDQEKLTGLTFLQTSLALCFFHHLPDALIKQIFSVGFLEKLDEELSNCYAKTTYPMRVRDHMMQLNRAVCLDYPEANVPWFHDKYIEAEQKKKQNEKQDYFHKQVDVTLQNILKDRNEVLNVNTYSPYGYHLDFQLTRKEDPTFKTVILLLKPNSFTKCTRNLKGYFQLRQRHLEILGYNVINISYDEWKKFYVQEHCIQFIRNKL